MTSYRETFLRKILFKSKVSSDLFQEITKLYLSIIKNNTEYFLSAPVLTIYSDKHEVRDRFYKAGSSIKLSCIISEEYVSTLPTKAPATTVPPATTTTPKTTTTELTTKMSTVFNRIDLMMNKSWSVETTTITSTVSISTTTTKAPEETTTMRTTTRPTAPPVLNNIYGLAWKKQGKDYLDNVTYRNMR